MNDNEGEAATRNTPWGGPRFQEKNFSPRPVRCIILSIPVSPGAKGKTPHRDSHGIFVPRKENLGKNETHGTTFHADKRGSV
jgi:hypothetical protein